MPQQTISYRIFIATPGGLDDERKAFRDATLEFNETMAISRGVHFIPVGWEETIGGDRRAQSLINDEVKECDYFVMALADRWGSPTTPGRNPEFRSGTQEEYFVSQECLESDDHPMRHRVVFFKQLSPDQLANPDTQLKRVLKFKQQAERDRQPLFHTLDDLRAFERMIRKLLARWLTDHERETLEKVRGPGPTEETEQLPSTADVSDEMAEPTEVAEPSETAAAERQRGLLADADRLADAGQLVEAEQMFAQAVVDGEDWIAFNRYGHFLRRLDRLTHAEAMYQRVLELAENRANEIARSLAYGNLGLVYNSRGDLDRAEEMIRRSLEIDERLGRQEGMANAYGNLGMVYRARGELDQAEEMHSRSLEIDERLGRQEGMATTYGNLGLVYFVRGELDRAEETLRHALEIHERLGRQEGMANQYGNLGLIYQARGDRDRAREFLTRACGLFQMVGMPHMVARVQADLDALDDGDTDHDSKK